jgi:hypothetical protein
MADNASAEVTVEDHVARHCTECKSEDMLFVEATRGAYGSGNVIPLSPMFNFWPMKPSVKVNRFVCMTCGYCEEWILNAKDRELLRRCYGPGSLRAHYSARWHRWGEYVAKLKRRLFGTTSTPSQLHQESK